MALTLKRVGRRPPPVPDGRCRRHRPPAPSAARSERTVVARAAVVLLLFVGLVGAGLAWHTPDNFVVTVNGKLVSLSWNKPSLKHALRAANISPRDGVLYSAVSRSVLDPRADPARLARNGVPAGLEELVEHGDYITVLDGHDRMEEVHERTVPLLPQGFPDIETTLWLADAGSVLEKFGAQSGELVERRVLSEPIDATPETRSVVALTFDDGPDPRWTPSVLDILRQERVTATFCIVGLLARRYPELVQRVAEAGHTLCNHTEHHVVNLGHRSADAVTDEIASAGASIAEAVGESPRFYRPPGGTLTPGVVEEARRQGMRILGWSVDPFDWTRPGRDVILDRVLSKVRPGGIVLLHDGGGDRSQTVEQLRELIRRLRAKGFGFSVPGARAPRPDSPVQGLTPEQVHV